MSRLRISSGMSHHTFLLRKRLKRLLALSPTTSTRTLLSLSITTDTIRRHPIALIVLRFPEEYCLPLDEVAFCSPTPSREVGESSAAGAARQDRPTISRDDPLLQNEGPSMMIAPNHRKGQSELPIVATIDCRRKTTSMYKKDEFRGSTGPAKGPSQPDGTRPETSMINEGVTAALAARDATRNGDDSHTSGTGARRPVQVVVNAPTQTS
ncbi:hypothetical protein Tco_1218785 [Tanacetum coccineum]